MTMPKWHETMRPILEALAKSDGCLTGSDLQEAVATTFDMTGDERAERLKSGRLRLYDRVYWGITDLEKAKLLEYGEKKGTYCITDAGKEYLSGHSEPITAKALYDRCPAFKAWKDGYQAAGKAKASDAPNSTPTKEDQESPQEAMDSAYGEIRSALADDLISAIMGKDPYFFEHLVGKLLVAMGYGESLEAEANVTKKSGDEGIDGVVREDRLGFGTICYQAKRWDPSRTVGRPEVQAFVGALSGKGVSKGLFITTARFSKEARRYADGLLGQTVVLVDGSALAGLMIDYGVGVSTRQVYEIKAVDTDFFEE